MPSLYCGYVQDSEVVMTLRPLQLTLAVLKPDLLLRPLAAKAVRDRILDEGFLVVRSAVMKWKFEDALQFYSEHRGKFFYWRLVTYMTSGPLNPMVLAHPSAVQRCREIMGPTKSYVAQIAAPHSIRGMYGLTDTRNSIHGSDSEESVQREVPFFFPDFDSKRWLSLEEPAFRAGRVAFCQQKGVHETVDRGVAMADIGIDRVHQLAQGT